MVAQFVFIMHKIVQFLIDIVELVVGSFYFVSI